MADNVTGIVLDIPPTVLQNIKDADKAIKQLEATSHQAAQKIKGHFDNTMVSGVNAFIKKVQEAQGKLNGLKMPTIDTSKMNLSGIGTSASKSASDVSALVQSLSQLTAVLEKNKGARASIKNVATQETEYSRLSAELAKQAERYTQLTLAIEVFNQKKREETSLNERRQNAANIQELQALQQTLPLLREKVALMEKNARAAQTANNPTLQTRKAQEELAQMNKMYADEEKASARKAAQLEKDRKREAEAARKAYEQQQRLYEKLFGKGGLQDQQVRQSLAQQKAQTLATPQGAIDYAKNARHLKEMTEAYKNLKAVMATTNPSTKEWRQMNAVLEQTRDRIDKIKKKMGEFKSTAQGVGDIAGQMKRTLAAVFSVSAITGYINKLIEVREQFELQQTALRAMLQDKQKADEVFQQVQQMALQSPFSIMQMTTFTKQLAAYRIEADKLVGTTKMLADVSAGLGVDMGRLILAYGQVKAANYLRATEVRQFTEAGLNIAGELATYFSEIEGRMISVGDVMEMITKRMVRFEDVEEVFKRVTSAGGLFYDMQRKQSETLRGQMQRIKDAMSIMFNEIGKSNQGTIAWFLTAIREIINNWRTFAVIIKDVGASIALFFAAKQIARFVAYWPTLIANAKVYGSVIKEAVKSLKNLRTAMSMISATGWGAIIAAVGMLGVAIYQAVSATDELKEELDRIANESAKDMWDLVYAFRANADAVRDINKSYDERKKALEELHNTFRDVLPDHMLEYEYITHITDGYREATDAIMIYSAEKAKQAAADAMRTKKEKKYGEVIENAKKLAPNIISLYDLSTDSANIASIKGVIGNIMRQIQREVEDGSITTAQQGYDKFLETLQGYLGQMPSTLEAEGFKNQLSDVFFPTRFRTDFEEYLNFGIEQQREFEAEYSQLLSREMRQGDMALQATKMRYNKRKQALERLQTAYLNYYDLKKRGEEGAQADEARAGLEQAVNAVNALQTGEGQAQVQMENLVAATTSQTDVMIEFGKVQDNVLGSFLRHLIETGRSVPAIVNWAEETEGALRRAGLSDTQLEIIQIAKDFAAANGVASASVDRLRISADSNFTSAAQDAKKLSDQAAENILQIEQSRMELLEYGATAENALRMSVERFGNGKNIDELKKEKKFWEDLAKVLGYIANNNNTGGGSTRDVWTPRLQLIEKVNREYEKLLKYYSKEEAMTRIRQSYGDAVAETFKNTQWADIAQWGEFDDAATIERMQAVGEAAGGAYKRKFLEAAGTIQSEIDIKIEEKNIQTAKDQIQELFDNYELTKTLGNLGLNVDLTYLVGGQPVKLEDVRRKLETELADVRATGGEEDIVKAYEEALRKVTEMENKNAIERLKNYNKYLLESMSERVQIELKAQQEISKIRNDETLDEFSKEQAINNRRKQMQEELTKYDFDQFKGSDVYLQTFKDLERASKTQLQYVIDRLKEMQAVNKDLSPLQVKSIAQEIKKAEDALAKQDSLKNLIPNIKTAIEYTKQRNSLLSEQVRLSKELTAAQLEQGEAQKRLTELTQNRDAIADKNSQAWGTANALVEEQQRLVKEIEEKAEALGVDLKGITDTIGKGEASLNNIKGLWNNIAQTLNAISSTIGDISAGLEDMGLMSDGLADAFSSAQAILGNFVQFGSGAVQAFTDPSPWGKLQGALGAVGGAMKLVGSIFAIGDKKKERQIKRLQEKVEDLQRAYEKLHTAIEDAYTFDDYNAGYNQSMKNLQEQRQAIQEQLALERAKKKSDEGKIQGYIDALDELKEKEKELRESRYEAMGSMGDKGIMSEAENWAKTWLDAYKETGDGLDALSDQWDEFFENLVLKQATSAVVSKRMKKYVDQINAAIDSGDTGLSLSQTFAQIGQNLKNELGIWNEDLKAFFDAVGIKGGQGELLLSDLQKGIQNITEPQAAAIEAYLNSMRFAVFEQNNILTNMLTAIQAQYSTNGDSPVLQEVRAIRTLVASIDDRLSRVIVSRNSASSGYSVKVS